MYTVTTINFNPLHATGFFPYPLRTSENLWLSGFLMFSGGIERNQWFLSHEMSHIAPIYEDITIPLAKMKVTSRIQPQRIREHITKDG